MNLIKMLGLLAVVAAATTAFAATASADVATSPAGNAYTGELVAKNGGGHLSLHGSNGVTTECSSTILGSVTGHGAGKPVTGPFTSLSFTSCTNGYVVHVSESGVFSAQATSGGNALMFWSGAKFAATAKTIFGTITCEYSTSNTSIGTFTGGASPKLDISATIPRTGGSSLCGNSGVWTGSYEFTKPNPLTFDKT